MSKYADIEQIKEVIRTEWCKYMPSDLDINLSFVLGKIAEVPTIEVSEDCISRERTLEKGQEWKIEYLDNNVAREALTMLMNEIEHAPSVISEPKEGEWQVRFPYDDTQKVRMCSNCKITQSVNIYEGKVRFRFCPYCGAKMKG